jgi:predicted esterase
MKQKLIQISIRRECTQSFFIACMMVMTFFIYAQTGICAVTAERILPQTSFMKGQEQFKVEIQISGEEDTVFIKEKIPTGWIVNRILNNGVLNGDTISWEITSLSGSSIIRYYLNAPDDAENDAQFSGTVNDIPIGGDSVMELRRSIPTPGKQVPMYSSLYNYWLYLPSDYSEQEGQWPLIIFLHGGCMVGTELDLVLTHYDVSVLTVLENAENAEIVPELFQSIVVSPQSTTMEWDIERLNEFIIELLSTYSIDPNRVNLNGHNIGADACWAFANQYPDLLASFFSGGMMTTPPTVSANMAGLPVWVFEFEIFKTIDHDVIESCVNELKALGGECVYTLIPSLSEYGVEDLDYDPELYKWFMKQNKQSRFSGVEYWEMY